MSFRVQEVEASQDDLREDFGQRTPGRRPRFPLTVSKTSTRCFPKNLKTGNVSCTTLVYK